MNDKKIKMWLWVFVATLALSGGLASFFAQKITLYRGNEPLEKVAGNVAKAQAHNGSPQEDITATPISTDASSKTNFVPLKTVKIECDEDEVPFISEGIFSGCVQINTGFLENAGEKISVPK